MNEMFLTHENEVLNNAMQDFDLMLERTIGNMTMRNADEAVLTMKIGISLGRKTVPDAGGIRQIVQPSFKHDISSVMQVKDKMSGTFKGNVELTFDDMGHPIVRDVDDGQVSIFDEDGKVVVDYETDADEDVKKLLGDGQKQLPEEASEEYGYDEPEDE